MRIAYLTTDEVNEYVATELAARHGATLHQFSPADVLPVGEYDAVICDWDFLPRAQRKTILRRLIRSHGGQAVAVHSYNVQGKQVHALRRRRVKVYRRLRSSIFVRLTKLQCVQLSNDRGLLGGYDRPGDTFELRIADAEHGKRFNADVDLRPARSTILQLGASLA
jgi:hypothetical protein